MRHLITGGSGFIGSLVARRLSERGEDVRTLDIRRDPLAGAKVEQVDGSVLEREAVARAMQGVDVVHHNAALVAQSDASRRLYWDVNVEGTRIVAEEAARRGVKAIVHISSTSVYGIPPDGPITAATPRRPVEGYGASKLAAEELIAELCGRAAIPLITIRPRVTLGSGRLGIFQLLFEWIAENRTVYVVGSGENKQQFIHVQDLMDFYMLALAAGKTGTFNVGTDRFASLREDIGALVGHAGSTSRIRSLPVWPTVNGLRVLHLAGLSPLVPWHYLTYHRDCYFDISPLLAMGWRPNYSNVAMLCESFDWYRTKGQAAPDASAHRSPLRKGILSIVKRLP
jgi:nucleoside-diphosphate-sugar epimerase